jgi:hypothetical protein
MTTSWSSLAGDFFWSLFFLASGELVSLLPETDFL